MNHPSSRLDRATQAQSGATHPTLPRMALLAPLAVMTASILSACGMEAPRTPYEARQQLESAGQKVSQTKEQLDKTADKTVEKVEDVGDNISDMADKVVENLTPAAEMAKEGLIKVGETVMEVKHSIENPPPVPDNITQPYRSSPPPAPPKAP